MTLGKGEVWAGVTVKLTAGATSHLCPEPFQANPEPVVAHRHGGNVAGGGQPAPVGEYQGDCTHTEQPSLTSNRGDEPKKMAFQSTYKHTDNGVILTLAVVFQKLSYQRPEIAYMCTEGLNASFFALRKNLCACVQGIDDLF